MLYKMGRYPYNQPNIGILAENAKRIFDIALSEHQEQEKTRPDNSLLSQEKISLTSGRLSSQWEQVDVGKEIKFLDILLPHIKNMTSPEERQYVVAVFSKELNSPINSRKLVMRGTYGLIMESIRKHLDPDVQAIGRWPPIIDWSCGDNMEASDLLWRIGLAVRDSPLTAGVIYRQPKWSGRANSRVLFRQALNDSRLKPILPNAWEAMARYGTHGNPDTCWYLAGIANKISQNGLSIPDTARDITRNLIMAMEGKKPPDNIQKTEFRDLVPGGIMLLKKMALSNSLSLEVQNKHASQKPRF